ncbi:cation:proton antiporter [Leucobacter luti]|uniref:Sodium/proton antiporter (CPA1 family) n=1 Tax=Leucobacter luti TaxID=340320 RepID=A0A4V6MDP9_9MICO|nr:sodium:proton antiporter [Leucobacter luti]MBL3700950.1 sodium:proton antiporter [Leucobacter luti]RZT68829.1 sodium/proton antiporter (CPA1 family) [Leucobacter luti]
MEVALIAVIAVIVLVGASILGGRIGVAAPLVLVVTGIGIGYLPFVPLVEIDPEVVLLGVLPPLLYAAAVNVPLIDFRRNLRPVVGLSVLLVVITAVVVGAVLHFVVPTIPLPVAIALGAVISPTDAVAATSIGKRLGMPDRVVAILEGESLVNDATSLVLLKTAIAAVSGSFVFWEAAGSFAFSVTVAIAVGGLIGVITVWIRSKLHNPVYDTMVSFAVPFVSFIPAEAMEASGVLAVVVTGLYTGHHASRRFSATARMNERLNWRTVQFAMENGVFLVMGLQLHALVEHVGESPLRLEHVLLISVALVAVLIVCRALFMVPLIASMRGSLDRFEQRSNGFTRLARRAQDSVNTDERRLQRVERLAKRTQADLEHERSQRLGWRDGAALSWSGMRGVVTLAAAQSIPVGIPYRAQIILIAFGVAVITLLLHGLTLPLVIRKLWPNGSGAGASTSELVSLKGDLVEAADAAIDDAIANGAEDQPPVPEAVVERARANVRNGLAPITLTHGATGAMVLPSEETPARAFVRLSRVALEAQRTALLDERAIGRYSSQALRAAELALDAHETRLTPPGSHA